jgi:hypothetical protein
MLYATGDWALPKLCMGSLALAQCQNASPLKIIIVFRDELLHSRLLYFSVVEGNESIVRLLLEYGADVNAAHE